MIKENKIRKILILNKKTHKQFKLLAKKRDMSVSKLYRMLVKEYIESRR